MKKFVRFDAIMMRQKELKYNFDILTESEKLSPNGYKLNQDLLLLSLYTLIPPLRNEVKLLDFTFEKQTEGDWIYFHKNGDVIMMLNLYKKRHSEEEFDISKDSPELADILKQSYQLYPRTPIFATIKDGKFI